MRLWDLQVALLMSNEDDYVMARKVDWTEHLVSKTNKSRTNGIYLPNALDLPYLLD